MASKGNAGRGRPKGSRNKVTNEVKAAIMAAYEGIGGATRLIEWIKKNDANETLFWTKIFPMVMPRPAPEPAEPAEPPPAMPRSFTWKTPEWAKKAHKAQLKSGVAQIGKAVKGAAGETRPPGPDEGREGGSG